MTDLTSLSKASKKNDVSEDMFNEIKKTFTGVLYSDKHIKGSEYFLYLQYLILFLSPCKFRRKVILEYVRFIGKMRVNNKYMLVDLNDKDIKRLLKRNKLSKIRSTEYIKSRKTYLTLTE